MSRPQATSVSEVSSTASEHRTARRLRLAPAAALLVAAACGGGGQSASSTSEAATTAAATTVPRTTSAPTTAPTTVATTIRRPVSSTLPVPTVQTVPVVRPAATTAAPAGAAPAAPAGGNASEGYGPFGPFTVLPLDDASRAAVAAAVEAYVVTASVQPLRTGQPADLQTVLTPEALARLTPAERLVLTDGADAGLAGLQGVVLSRAQVGVDGIVGPDGGAVAAATLDTEVTATTAGGSPVRITRTGSLLLFPSPTGWRIDEFDLVVVRELP